ncbi:MAG: hypothetical protein KF788_12285 [Piscinibacter sp.]|nr:hypothetical protein [Piscinibacter sp.]
MKEYRLAAWPDLDAFHDRIAYRRLLSDMSQRFVPLSTLVARSGLSRPEVARFLDQLEAGGLVLQRERAPAGGPVLRPLRSWLRRALGDRQSS